MSSSSSSPSNMLHIIVCRFNSDMSMSKKETSIGDEKGFEQMRDSRFSTLTGGVSGEGGSFGVSEWQLTLSIVALESRD